MQLKILTMAFNRPEVVERSLLSAFATGSREKAEHFVLDQHYPLPDRAANRRRLEDFCRREGVTLLDAGGNLGYHEGQNWAIERMGLADGDALVNYDPDALIRQGSEAWLDAIRDALEGDPSLAVVGLVHDTIEREFRERGCRDAVVRGRALRYVTTPVIMSIVAWRAGFVREVGGLKEPARHYGGIEATMFPLIRARGRSWAVLKEFWEDRALQALADPEYVDWKRKHGYERSFEGSFEDYLRAVGRIS